MKYDVISADGHVDLIWLPPDLFTKNASAGMKDRMPHVIDGPKGPAWVSAKGAKFGLVKKAEWVTVKAGQTEAAKTKCRELGAGLAKS